MCVSMSMSMSMSMCVWGAHWVRVGTDANHSTPELRWLPRRLTGAGGQRAVAIKRQQPRMVYAHAYVGAAAGEPARRHLEERVRFVEVDGLELIEDDECPPAS